MRIVISYSSMIIAYIENYTVTLKSDKPVHLSPEVSAALAARVVEYMGKLLRLGGGTGALADGLKNVVVSMYQSFMADEGQSLELDPLNGKAKFVFADDGNAMLVPDKGNGEDEPLNICLILLSVLFRNMAKNDESTSFEKALKSAFDAGFWAP